MVPYLDTPTSFTFFFTENGKFQRYSVNSDHENFQSVRALVIYEEDIEEAIKLLDTKKFITVFSNGVVSISDNDDILINGAVVSDYIVDRIRELYAAEEPFDSLGNFAAKLQENPNPEVREDLYKWLENGKMPLTPDGDFIAYKKVQDDYYSYHSGKNGKVFHGIGQRVSMDREDCDEDRNRTCSSGLHFCSYEYLNCYAGTSGKVLAVRINPRDVTAIPADYNLAKGRGCAYTVISELDPETAKFAFEGSPVYRSWNDDYEEYGYREEPSYDHYSDDYYY